MDSLSSVGWRLALGSRLRMRAGYERTQGEHREQFHLRRFVGCPDQEVRHEETGRNPFCSRLSKKEEGKEGEHEDTGNVTLVYVFLPFTAFIYLRTLSL